MSIEKQNKLKHLHTAWPKNTVLTTRSLKASGFSDQLIQKYCYSGWLKRIGVGAFVRQDDHAIWQGGLYAIQHNLDKSIHIGGLSALEIHGLRHYLGLSPNKAIYLYNTSSIKQILPGWFSQHFNQRANIHYRQCHIFEKEVGLEVQIIEGLNIIVSQPERAILELLYLVPKTISVEHAAELVENLQTIRPENMQQLLEGCSHILVKRLFLCLADLCQLPVLKYLDMEKINLGSGKRTVGHGGRYFHKYKLVLPYNSIDNLEQDTHV